MRKNLRVVLMIVALGLGAVGLFLVLGKGVGIETQEVKQQTKPQAKISESSLENSEILLPGTNVKVKLVDGKATYQKGDDLQNITFVSMIGQTPTPDGVDIFASLADNMGGSGDFVYVGLFHIAGDKVDYTSSSDFLGDRILIKSATASKQDSNDYDLTVNYLDRTDVQAMADMPTIPKTVKFQVKDNLLLK